MKICVFGLWHLGSVTAGGLAKSGHTVTGLDFDRENIESLRKGLAPVAEPGLNELLSESIRKSTLDFTCDPHDVVPGSDVIWIAFDTPVDEQDNADPGYIEKNFDRIAEFVQDKTRIIISSQVPVGFTRHLVEIFHQKYPGKKIFVAYSPENLRLGKALRTFLDPDRIVIGVNPVEQEQFLPVFLPVSDRLEWMSIESAEMTKHAINAFLATSVCFANEIATLCEKAGADAKEVERGLKTEERIGPKAYLTPGNAFSGGTLARDVRFLQKMGCDHRLPVYLINSVIESNEFHKTWIRRRCQEALGDLRGKYIAVLGLTYKPGTDTLRRSASVELCKWLSDEGAVVTVFDPAVHHLPPELEGRFSLTSGIAEAVRNAACIIIATEWPEFQKMNDEELALIRKKIVIDPNGFIEKQVRDQRSLSYFAVGRSYS